ncbi:membrane protein [Pontibacillus halophilus JSM 076056 = DSM 19796]|uniref:Membrane protein n=1 Tax=Pontibacillus halophilus JSM 076056 = DSM 19796 TaxID=1385510 RepID=A0A0A5GG60_9BACI|nr:YqzK family protein [Pontibacillus halophilus]KGX92236.1 membrane protein [Pontibacillus halophilus JSM 076056 = DSM 19796]
MKRWVAMIKDTLKVFILFITCTVVFYYGLQLMHDEYEQFHRYDEPTGKAVKVSSWEEPSLVERLTIFLRLGE